jgi:hypothetical protein
MLWMAKPMSDREVHVIMTFTARVPTDYGPHEVADAVRFHVGLSELNSMEADISAIEITKAQEVNPPADRNPDTVGRWLDL